MRTYQILGLLIVTTGIAFVVGLRVGEHRGAMTACAAGSGGGDCSALARPSGGAATKPPPIPTGSGRPCLVEFGSDECNECQRMTVVLQEIAPQLKATTDVVKLDTDVHPSEAQRWRLRMVPTQILVDAKGREMWRHEGYIATTDLLAKVTSAMGARP